MAFDEALAERIRKVLGPRLELSEKKMFGGLAFLADGKMFCGLAKGELMLRVGPERYEEALTEPHVRPMDFTGRPLQGYVYISPAGLKTEKALRRWVEQALTFVGTVERAPKRRAKRGAAARTPARGRAR